jgi:hypothetical protein
MLCGNRFLEATRDRACWVLAKQPFLHRCMASLPYALRHEGAIRTCARKHSTPGGIPKLPPAYNCESGRSADVHIHVQ